MRNVYGNNVSSCFYENYKQTLYDTCQFNNNNDNNNNNNNNNLYIIIIIITIMIIITTKS